MGVTQGEGCSKSFLIGPEETGSALDALLGKWNVSDNGGTVTCTKESNIQANCRFSKLRGFNITLKDGNLDMGNGVNVTMPTLLKDDKGRAVIDWLDGHTWTQKDSVLVAENKECTGSEIQKNLRNFAHA